MTSAGLQEFSVKYLTKGAANKILEATPFSIVQNNSNLFYDISLGTRPLQDNNITLHVRQ